MSVTLALPLLLLLAAGPAPSVHDIFALPLIEGNRPSAPLPSPDGRRVAFLWNDRGGRSPIDLWVVEAAGGEPRNLTRLADPTPRQPLSARPYTPRKGEEPRRAGVESFDWSPGGRELAFAALGDLWLVDLAGRVRRLTDSEVQEANPQFSPDGSLLLFESGGDLWLWPLAGAEGRPVVQLTRHEERRPLGQAAWSPRGDRLLAIRREEGERGELVVPDYLPEKVAAGKTPGGWYGEGVVLLSAAGGEPLTLDLGAEAPFNLNAARFSRDGRRLVVDGVSKDQKVRTLHLVELDGAAPRVRRLDREHDERWVWSGDGILSADPVTSFSPDGRRLLWLSERSGWATAWVLDLAVDGARPRMVGGGSWETTWAAWADDAHLLLLDNRSHSHERRLWRVGLQGGEAQSLGRDRGLAQAPVLARDRGLVVVSQSRFDEPSDLVGVRLPGGETRTLTRSVPAAFSAVDWAVPEVVPLVAFDGTPLKALVHPAPPGPRPAVIFVHGAGYMQNVLDGWTIYSPNFKFATVLARRGFLVAEVDYRGSAGYGREFRTGVYKHLGGKDLDDIVKLARWLRETRGATKVGIYGGSYGGFAALMALFQHPADFRSGAALRAVADWENYARGNPWYCRQRLGLPEEDPEAYRRSSPIHFAAGLEGDLLLLHGVKDGNVHFQDAAQLASRLIQLDKPFELMIYPHEGHGFAAPESWIDEYRRIEEFFTRTLR